MRVGIVYDGGWRDNGTPWYLRFAMQQHFGEPPIWSTEAGPIEELADFYVHVDDGRDDLSVAGIPHPWGYWVVDSHLGPKIRIEKARQADIVWCAQKPFVEVLAGEGIKAKWLPLACEPLLHCTAEELAKREGREVAVPEFDLAFVGHLGDPGRLQFLDELWKKFPNSWFEYGVFHDKMAAVYHRAKLGVNHAVRDDLNMRFFEIASMGVPQLADARMVGLEDLGFLPWSHFIPHPSYREIHRGIYWFGSQASLRLAEAAFAKVRASHTYRHRLCTMLDDIKAEVGP